MQNGWARQSGGVENGASYKISRSSGNGAETRNTGSTGVDGHRRAQEAGGGDKRSREAESEGNRACEEREAAGNGAFGGAGARGEVERKGRRGAACSPAMVERVGRAEARGTA